MSTIDTEFVHSGDYAQIRQTAEMLRGLLGAGAYVQRGDKKQPVRDFPEVMRWLLAEVEKSMSLQRYKGLGEMNPGQLWETTMDPTVRGCPGQIDDGIAADEIFIKLMGDEVAAPRLHRNMNALGVRNSTLGGTALLLRRFLLFRSPPALRRRRLFRAAGTRSRPCVRRFHPEGLEPPTFLNESGEQVSSSGGESFSSARSTGCCRIRRPERRRSCARARRIFARIGHAVLVDAGAALGTGTRGSCLLKSGAGSFWSS
jgi:hypothetical protein